MGHSHQWLWCHKTFWGTYPGTRQSGVILVSKKIGKKLIYCDEIKPRNWGAEIGERGNRTGKKIKAGEQKQAYTTLLEKPPALWAWPVKITRQHKHTHNSSVKFFEAGGRTARMVGSLFPFSSKPTPFKASLRSCHSFKCWWSLWVFNWQDQQRVVVFLRVPISVGENTEGAGCPGPNEVLCQHPSENHIKYNFQTN